MSSEAAIEQVQEPMSHQLFSSVLCVCTYNQSRSVMMGGFLRDHLDLRGIGPEVRVATAGLHGGGHPPTSHALAQLGHRGRSVQGHVSRAVDAFRLVGRDVVVTAERAHVASIAGRWPEMFDRTFTLPELVGLLDAIAPTDPDVWSRLGASRIAKSVYLDAPEVGEIDEPGGGSPADWRHCARTIDALTGRLADWVAQRHLAMAGQVR